MSLFPASKNRVLYGHLINYLMLMFLRNAMFDADLVQIG